MGGKSIERLVPEGLLRVEYHPGLPIAGMSSGFYLFQYLTEEESRFGDPREKV